MKIKNKLTENTIAMAIVAAFVLLMMTACSTDTEITEANISGGTWMQESSKVNGKDSGFMHSYKFTSDHKVVDVKNYGTITYYGTYTLTNGELKCEFTTPQKKSLNVTIKQIDKHTLKWELTNSLGYIQETFKR